MANAMKIDQNSLPVEARQLSNPETHDEGQSIKIDRDSTNQKHLGFFSIYKVSIALKLVINF
jgi:hypothetical protein